MKKIFTVSLLLISLLGFSQQYSTPLRVKDSTTAFVSIVPISTIVQDTTTGNLWQLRAKGLVGHSLSNTAKQLIADPLVITDVKNLIHDSIVGAGTVMALGSDATGDMYYRNATGFLTRLGVGASGQVLNGGTVPSWGTIPAGANQYLNLSNDGYNLMITGQNLNSLQKTGFYGGVSLLNAPNSDPGYWFVENQVHAADWLTQKATAYGVAGSATAGTVFRRNKVSNVWSSWYQVYDGMVANNPTSSWTSNVLKVYPTGGGNSYNQGIRIHPSTSDQKSSLVLGAVTGDDNTGVGQWAINRMPSANNYQLNYNYNGTDVANLTKEGNFTANYIYGYKAIGTLSCDSVQTEIIIPSSTNWMKVTSFNTNELQQGVTVSVPFSNITVQRAGKYQVSYYFSSSSNINALLNTCVFVNGVKSKLCTIRYMSAYAYVEVSAMDVLTLTANDKIDVRVCQNSGSQISLNPQYGKLSVTYLSE